MTEYESAHGSIVHIELNTDEIDATREFFGEAFGWEFEEYEDMAGYVGWRAPNPPKGGFMAPSEGPFSPPSTVFYIGVDDLAEANDAIADAGGEILVEDMEVPGMGIFTMFQDPGGVINAAWEGRYEGEPPEGGWPMFTDEATPGSIVHFELYSDDPEATQTFHEAVFGWEFEAAEGDYTMIRPPTPPSGGVMAANEQMPVGTLAYVLVESASDACEMVGAAGGALLREPFDIEGWGTMAVFEAPGGIVQALWEAAPESMDETGEAEPHAAS